MSQRQDKAPPGAKKSKMGGAGRRLDRKPPGSKESLGDGGGVGLKTSSSCSYKWGE
jgi:hypothetical protein